MLVQQGFGECLGWTCSKLRYSESDPAAASNVIQRTRKGAVVTRYPQAPSLTTRAISVDIIRFGGLREERLFDDLQKRENT